MLRKEFYQILRDPSSLAIAFLLPLVLLLIFGYGVSLDAEHVPDRPGRRVAQPDTASFTSRFQQSRYFEPVFQRNLGEAEQALLDRRVMAIVHLRSDFARRLQQPGGAPIQVIVNGVDANTARLVLGYVQGSGRNGCSARRWPGVRRSPCRSSSSSGYGSTASCAAATFWCPA